MGDAADEECQWRIVRDADTVVEFGAIAGGELANWNPRRQDLLRRGHAIICQGVASCDCSDISAP